MNYKKRHPACQGNLLEIQHKVNIKAHRLQQKLSYDPDFWPISHLRVNSDSRMIDLLLHIYRVQEQKGQSL